MIVLIVVICICAWLIGAAVKYRLEELKQHSVAGFTRSNGSESGRCGQFDRKRGKGLRFASALVVCLFLSDVILMYVGSWDAFGPMAIKVTVYIVLHATFFHFVGLLPGSLIGAFFYTFHGGGKSGLFRKAVWWFIATYLLSFFLVDMGYGIVPDTSSLEYFDQGLVINSDSAGALKFFGVIIALLVAPAFLLALLVAFVVESVIFWGLVYALRPSKKAAEVVPPPKAHRHKRKRRF